MNYIDLSKLPVSDAKQVINIIGLNSDGGIIKAENDTYTKDEVDEKLSKVEVDLTGYATEQWVRRQGYVTDFDVNDYVGNEIGQVEERFNDYYTKVEVDELVANGGGGATELIVYDAENFTVRDLFKIHTEYTEGKNVIFFRDGVEYCTITNFFYKNLESNETEFRIEFDGQADSYYAFYKVVPNEVTGEILDEKLYYQRGDAQTPVYTYEIFNENNEIRINNRDVLMIYRNVTIGYPVRLHNSMEDGYYNVVSAEAIRNPVLSTTYKITAFGNLGNGFPSAFYIQTYIPNSVSGEFLEQLADVATQQMLLTWGDAFNQFYRKSEIDETIGDINNILTSI